MTRRIMTYADNLDNVLVLKRLAGNWVAHFRPDDATDAIHCDHAVPGGDGKGSHGFVRDKAERWRLGFPVARDLRGLDQRNLDVAFKHCSRHRTHVALLHER